jgi:opacity protein-like surface antigen
MLRTLLAFAGLLLAILHQPAAAADMPLKTPVTAAALPNWTGFYLGGHAGWAEADVTWRDVSFVPESFAFSPDRFVGGVHAGINYQTGPWVLGVEVGWTGGSMSQSALSSFGLVRMTTEIDGIVTVVGRVGLAHDRLLAYVSGGYASVNLKVAEALTGCCIPGDFISKAGENGLTFGGGIEYMLPGNFIIGVDYKYIDLGKTTRTGVTDQLIPVSINDIDSSIQMITGRISYKFGP